MPFTCWMLNSWASENPINPLGKKNSTLVVEFNLTMGYLFVLYPLVFSVQTVCQPLLAKIFTDKNSSLLQERFSSMSTLSLLLGCAVITALWVMPNPFSFYPDKEIANHCFLMLKILSVGFIVNTLSESVFCLLESTENIKKVAWSKTVFYIVRSLTIILFLYQSQDIHVSSIAMFYVAFDIVMFVYACLLLKTTTLFSQRWLAYIEGINLKAIAYSWISLIKMSAPLIFGIMIGRSMYYTLNCLISKIGVTEAASFAIVNSVISILQIPTFGLSILLTIDLGHAAGTQSQVTPFGIYKKFVVIFLAAIALSSLMFQLFLDQIIFFYTNDLSIAHVIYSHRIEINSYYIFMCSIFVTPQVPLQRKSDTFELNRS